MRGGVPVERSDLNPLDRAARDRRGSFELVRLGKVEENMSKAKHTPGPWTFRKALEGDDMHSHWIDGFPEAPGATIGKPIAEVREYYKGEGEANARLIAVAPDMASMLAEMSKHVQELLFYTNYPDVPCPAEKWQAASDAMEAAGQVLKRARGAS